MGNVFEISFASLNLLSFMLGMIFSFFNQGVFGVKIGKYIIVYFVGLAMYYGISYYVERDLRMQYESGQVQAVKK